MSTISLQEELNKINNALLIVPSFSAVLLGSVFYSFADTINFLDCFGTVDGFIDSLMTDDIGTIINITIFGILLGLSLNKRFFNQKTHGLFLGISLLIVIGTFVFFLDKLLFYFTYQHSYRLTMLLVFLILFTTILFTACIYKHIVFVWKTLLLFPVPFAVVSGVVDNVLWNDYVSLWMIGAIIGAGMAISILGTLRISVQQMIKNGIPLKT